MISENNIINDILAIHFSGEKLTDEQEEILINWVCQNREEYKHLSKIFDKATSPAPRNFNTEQAWKKVEAKLTQPKAFRLHQFRHYFSYAACLAIIFGISLFLLTKIGNSDNLYSNTTTSLLTVILPDSSTVTLYPQSKVAYFADTETNERKTELKGKAFFKVKPNAKHPFILTSNKTSIRVLGTSFLVDGTGHSETGVFVHEGTVQVSTQNEKVVLKANEQALSDGDNIVKSTIENSESIFEKFLKQKTYTHIPLSLVIGDIEKEFNVQIILNDSIKNKRISTHLKFANIEEILSEISYICNIKYQKLSDKEFELYIP